MEVAEGESVHEKRQQRGKDAGAQVDHEMSGGETGDRDTVKARGGVASRTHAGHSHVIAARDIEAALRHIGGQPDAAEAFAAWVDDDTMFASLDAVEAVCPPERIGLAAGAFAAILGPLFGEFE
jgi:hypothetical protein